MVGFHTVKLGLPALLNIVGVDRKLIIMLIFSKSGTPYPLFYKAGKQSGYGYLLFFKAGMQSGYPYPLFGKAGMKIIL